MAKYQPTPDVAAKIKELLVAAFDARARMAEKAFWDVRFSTVHECWEHCHGGITNVDRERELGKQRKIIAVAQGAINVLTDGEDWYDGGSSELGQWYDAEDKRRVKELAVMFVEQDY